MTKPEVYARTPHVAVPCGCVVGEGALWDHRTGTFLWVDIKDPSIWRYWPANGRHERVAVAERVGFVALTTDPDIVIAGFKTGLVRVHLFGGEVQPIVAPEPDRKGNRINDGCVGPDGHIYFGTMDDDEAQPTGAFYRWDGRSLVQFDEGFVVSNGPAIGSDGTLYAADTVGRTIFAYDLDAQGPRNRRVFARFEDGWGYPDGMAVDVDGHLWSCHWGGSCITRFDPDGSVALILPVPTAQVTKCAFGGPDLATLFITSAAIGHDTTIDPKAGHVFAIETGIRGLPAHIFQG